MSQARHAVARSNTICHGSQSSTRLVWSCHHLGAPPFSGKLPSAHAGVTTHGPQSVGCIARFAPQAVLLRSSFPLHTPWISRVALLNAPRRIWRPQHTTYAACATLCMLHIGYQSRVDKLRLPQERLQAANCQFSAVQQVRTGP